MRDIGGFIGIGGHQLSGSKGLDRFDIAEQGAGGLPTTRQQKARQKNEKLSQSGLLVHTQTKP